MQWEYVAISDLLGSDFCDLVWMLSEALLISPLCHYRFARLLLSKFQLKWAPLGENHFDLLIILITTNSLYSLYKVGWMHPLNSHIFINYCPV